MISTLDANVDSPTTLSVSAMLVMSSSVLPSTSKSPLASIAPVNVDTPVTAILPSTYNFLPSGSLAPIATFLS